VHLSDAGRREGYVIDVGEESRQRRSEVRLDHLARQIEAHRRRRRLQGSQGSSILLRHVVRHEARDLRELHDGALHFAHRREDLLGAAEVMGVEDCLTVGSAREP